MRVTLLGTGTSYGIPTIDCVLLDSARCPTGVCLKAMSDPRYRRMRASALFEWDGAIVLIDTSQDFYQQMLRCRVRRLDAVLFTHGHADHIYGLPDIRSYSRRQGGPIDIYGSRETIGILHKAFDYIFVPPDFVGGGIPCLTPHLLDGPFTMLGQEVIPVPVEHGILQGCLGYRIGDVAYLPDVNRIPRASLDALAGLDLLILNCLRFRPQASHLSFEESLAYATEIAPKRCLFTHIAHDIDPDVHTSLLPEWAEFAYDGMVVQL